MFIRVIRPRLVTSYLSARKQPKLWYHVDSGDTDIASFFYHLRLAVEQTARRKSPNLPLLTPEYLMDVPTFTQGYFRNLWARLPHPFVIVFDNYQNIAENAPLHDLIQLGLMQIPQGSKVIFISHSEPHTAFARLRASQAMTIVDGKALQFTSEEANGFVLSHQKGTITQEMQETLYRKSDGWVAGMILMLDRVNAHGALENETIPAINEKTYEVVFDYFLMEVLGRVSIAVKDFLLRSAFLPFLTVSMAERITETGFAERTLKDMARRHFFMTSRPDGTYKYHDLFQSFLKAQAGETFTPDELTAIRYRAAVALEEEGFFEEAVALFHEAQDWVKMIPLILKQAPSLLMQGRYKTLTDWLTALPQEISGEVPWLLFWWGRCQQPFDAMRSRELFKKAYQLFAHQGGDTLGLFSAWCGVVETFSHEWGDFTGMDSWIALMEGRLNQKGAFPSTETEARVFATMSLALTYRQPDHPDTRQWVERSLTLLTDITHPDIKMLAINGAALYYSFVGNFPKMEKVIALLGSQTTSNAVSFFEIIGYHSLEAISYWTSAANVRCITCVEKGLLIAQTSGIHLVDHFLLIQGLFGSLSAGNLQMGEVFLKQMGTLFSERRSLSVSQYYYFIAWEAWLKNNLPRAIEFARSGMEKATQSGTPFFEALCTLGLVQVLLTQGGASEIKTHLKNVRAFARKMDSNILLYMVLLLDAQLKLKQGDEKRAIAVLREAFCLGREQGYYNIPWWNAPVMTRLCVIALEQEIEVSYVQALIRKRNLYPDSPPLESKNWPWPIKIFTLGQVSILKEDQPIQSTGKIPKKPLELLYTLAASGEQGVREEHITELLWPVAEGDNAHWALETTVSRLRKLLGENDMIRLQEGWYSLSTRHCWVDTWAVTRLLAEIELAVQQMQSDTRKQHIDHLANKARVLYKGEFLGRGTPSWLAAYRESLHRRYLRHVKDLVTYWERAKDWERAQACCEEGLELDPTAEAKAVYERCRKVLAAALDVEPSDETKQIYLLL